MNYDDPYLSLSESSDDEIYEIPTPKSKRPDCTRDQRLKIQTLYLQAGWSKDDIMLQLNVTRRQIQYALAHRLTPQKPKSGRQPLLNPAQRNLLIEWVCSSATNRRVEWYQIPAILGWNCKVYAIATAFKLEGFSRRSALKKPKLSPDNVFKRLQWALEHLNWTEDQWFSILWTDEIWVRPGKHRKVKVTRRKGEALHKDCVEPKVQREIGWMFWGCISGKYGKGPGMFWEKAWGSINQWSYQEHTVPLIDSYIQHKGLILMLDNAGSHAAKSTLEEFKRRNITIIEWPANSPDLNPIETVWNWMKDYIQKKWGIIHRSYSRLREQVTEAWNSIAESDILDLIKSMPKSCQAVIEASGYHTKY
ncbi:hypothetical protein B7463_g2519, partial [Scytalidium lignicola]